MSTNELAAKQRPQHRGNWRAWLHERVLRRIDYPAFAAALVGLWWLKHIGGWETIRPTNVRWLLGSDWAAHELGWLFFRNDPWSFPLGSYHSYLHPVGSTVGYSDSIPAVAVVAKLFSPLLPTDFQYIGPWFALCFMLHGYVGAQITRVFSRDGWIRMAGGSLFVMTPTLLLRIGHPSLCAHWLLTIPIWLTLKRPSGNEAKKGAAVTLLAGAIHPYLALMTFVLTVALFVRLRWAGRFSSWAQVAFWSTGLAGGLVLVFWAFGYVGRSVHIEGGGFGRYSADLTTLFNSMGYSKYLPALPLEAGQYEGFAYLGGGALLLTILGVIIVSPLHVAAARWRAVLPLVVASSLFAIFAASPTVRFGGQPLVSVAFAYARVQAFAEAFRSSGRFLWPLHYLCITLGIAVVARTLWRQVVVARAVLIVAVALQVADLNVKPSSDKFRAVAFHELKGDGWAVARGAYDHIALHPPQIYAADCGGYWDESHVYSFAYQAYKLHMTINSGYVARFDGKAVADACRTAAAAIAAQQLDERTIYVPWTGVEFPRAHATCGQLDGREVCVAASRATAFSERLAQAP